MWYVLKDNPSTDTQTNTPISVDQARKEYLALRRKIFSAGRDGLGRRLRTELHQRQYGKGEGYMHAFMYAWVVWWREWAAAAQSGDQVWRPKAAAASHRLLGSLPIPRYRSELVHRSSSGCLQGRPAHCSGRRSTVTSAPCAPGWMLIRKRLQSRPNILSRRSRSEAREAAGRITQASAHRQGVVGSDRAWPEEFSSCLALGIGRLQDAGLRVVL